MINSWQSNNKIKIIEYNKICYNTIYNIVYLYAYIYSKRVFTHSYESILKKVIP